MPNTSFVIMDNNHNNHADKNNNCMMRMRMRIPKNNNIILQISF
jgi:hypothetical protein